MGNTTIVQTVALSCCIIPPFNFGKRNETNFMALRNHEPLPLQNPLKMLPSVWKSHYLLYQHALRIISKRLEDHYKNGRGLELRMVLVLMGVSETPCSQKYLGRALGIDPNTMVDLIDKMEAKHLIRRLRNPHDRREYTLEVTVKGMVEVKWIYDNWEPAVVKIWHPLSTETLDLIDSFVKQIVDAHYEGKA